MDDEIDLYGLFLALGEQRMHEARAALALGPGEARDERLRGSLVPLAVDAALLGAEGVSTLARALAEPARDAPADALAHAIDALAAAVSSLAQGDASGARADESSLIALARSLGRGDVFAGDDTAVARAPVATPQGPGDDTLWIPTLPEELVASFLDECQERIEGLSARLLELEREGVDAAGGEGVRALFRDLHTLKGSSGFAGLTRLNRLAHAAEDLVAKVRDGTAPCDRPVIDALLGSVDRFRAIVDRASARQPIDVEVDDLVARLANPRAAVAAPKPTLAVKPVEGVAARPSAGAGTLRVEFERVDQLQNFVNELVLARGRLGSAAVTQLGLGRELARLRRHVQELAGGRGEDTHETRAASFGAVADELGRAERVVGEGNLELEGSLGALGTALAQLRERVMRLRMVPIARLFTKHQRTVRELGQALGKKIRLDLRGQETELDKVLVEQLEDPLIHLVRNAIDHGLETPETRAANGKDEVGTLSLRARQQGGAILVSVADDGGGIDPDRIRRKAVEKGVITEEEAGMLDERGSLELIFRAGFSTASEVTDVSGRGVGMDVVRESIERLKGTIEIHSRIGEGTSFELRLPLTLAVAQVLLVRAGGEEVAVPIDAVARSLALGQEGSVEVEDVGGRPCLVERLGAAGGADARVRRVPIIELAPTLGLEDNGRDMRSLTRNVGGSARRGGHVVVLEAPLSGVEAVALECDALLGRHDVVVKPLGTMLASAPCVAGASLIGDRVVLLLDIADVVRRGLDSGAVRRVSTAAVRGPKKRLLVVEDADVIREALRRALESAGYDVTTARDGLEGLELARLERFDLISTDVMMPRMDGYGLTRALRALPEHARTPIVMVTSRDQRVDVLRGYDAGVDAYVTKPADVQSLLRTIEELFAKATA